MGSRESSTMCSSQVIRNSSIYVFACVLIAALGYIQFGFTCDYSSPTKAAITKDLSLTVCEAINRSFCLELSVSDDCWLALHIICKRYFFPLQGRLLEEGFVITQERGLNKHMKRLSAPKHWMLDKLGVRTKGHPFPEHIRWSHISNDTIKIDMEENKIVEFIKFAVGNVVMVAGGTNRGRVSVIKNSVKHK
uniref:Small ribosomal subunit protein eS4 N-terminal domain-containing protein n=1 Tax=Brassica campestris TaxID=3711 RepID=A0A3P5Z7B0_BRACM|nr:unnamed protein product [Brassica rapa]